MTTATTTKLLADDMNAAPNLYRAADFGGREQHQYQARQR